VLDIYFVRDFHHVRLICVHYITYLRFKVFDSFHIVVLYICCVEISNTSCLQQTLCKVFLVRTGVNKVITNCNTAFGTVRLIGSI
jgi:hypothetical protein